MGYLIHREAGWLLALITPADIKAKDSQSQVHQNRPWSVIHLHVWKADEMGGGGGGGRKGLLGWAAQKKSIRAV